ncbi:MAG: alkaline phosphatase family protein [Planctomycetaceae bacterium]
MSTQQSAQVYVKNDTQGTAYIQLSHKNSTNGTQSGEWTAAPGEKVGPLTVYFKTGISVAGVLDYWWIKASVSTGPNPGIYSNTGSITSAWKECQLQSKDAGKNITMTVSTTEFETNLPSGSCSNSMERLGPYTGVSNVFVLMLENHSFDNIFAFSGIPGLTTATTSDSNSYNGTSYPVVKGAPASMPNDPGHEFQDVYRQLTGNALTINNGVPSQPVNPYPAANNSGFAVDFAVSGDEGTGPPAPGNIGDVMKCFDTPNQLPVIYTLATEFAICDHWFSSLPGPTWPNRFFVHGASSAGQYNSPSNKEVVTWETVSGFKYPHGSIFDLLEKYGYQWRLYNDRSGPVTGAFPQVTSLKGIQLWDSHSLSGFASDLQGPYPYQYTFIEPNYGNAGNGTYTDGTSQHPMDSTSGGEALIKSVYEAIRNSPVWNTSLLIITYDEHGGFYDSVKPGAAPPPNDGSTNDIGYTFSNYGVRVPAVIVSPRIPKGTVDHTVYDHSSVPKTLEENFYMPSLTNRDEHANNVMHLLSLTTPRTDCPTTLPNPVQEAPTAKLETVASNADDPIPESSNMVGFLAIAVKADIDMAGNDQQAIAEIQAKAESIKTLGEAQAYMESVQAKVDAKHAAN